MIWATRIVSFISLLALAASLPLEQDKREIYVPWITSPNENTIWLWGSMQTVAWDTTNAPSDFDGCRGASLYLIQEDYMYTLALDFDLSKGSYWIQDVPNRPGSYRVKLSCANYSDQSQVFKIT
ncbi:hypothetical protein L210DRAFT_945917 [Boletus edulis BED1]|uniref:Uncharacterized protein n=1 Tax=Boletus edulis BED1 TaxID=1328754 RepID=A0AAD4GEY9_BOLED|nr:hypothetical protein L210DRAFT_945917 [Boletus edulis BED1]